MFIYLYICIQRERERDRRLGVGVIQRDVLRVEGVLVGAHPLAIVSIRLERVQHLRAVSGSRVMGSWVGGFGLGFQV